MAENEIEFETPAEIDNKPVVDLKKLEGLETKITNLETKFAAVITAVEELKKLLAEPKPVDNSLKDSVTSLTKKVEELESKPARITQTLSEETPETKVKEFLGQVTGADALVWAEKKGIKWGAKDGE